VAADYVWPEWPVATCTTIVIVKPVIDPSAEADHRLVHVN